MKLHKKKASQKFRLLFISVIALELVFTVGIFALLAYIFNVTELLSIDIDKELGWFVIVIWISVSIIFGLGVSFLFGTIIMKPIKQIIGGMSLLSDGFYDISIDFGKISALKELGDCFNKLAKELKNNEIMSKEFINNFSHELKTPLVSISGLINLMKQKDFPEEKRNQYLFIIEEEANRLASLTTNILSLSKLENQKIVTDKEKFNFSEQVRKCILLLEKKWDKKQLELSMDFKEYMFVGNEDMIKQMCLNLIDNAIKFAYEKTELYINVSEDDEYVILEVENESDHLNEVEIEKIFNKFYRVENSKYIEGNGIGLSIVKKIVELHDGDINVISNNNKVRFIIRLAK